jgi:hypothetical protein
MAVRTFMKSPGNSISCGVGIENRYTTGYYFCFVLAYYSEATSNWEWKQSDWKYVNGQSSAYLGSVTLNVRSDEPKGWKWVWIGLYRYDESQGKALVEDQLEGMWLKVV